MFSIRNRNIQYSEEQYYSGCCREEWTWPAVSLTSLLLWPRRSFTLHYITAQEWRRTAESPRRVLDVPAGCYSAPRHRLGCASCGTSVHSPPMITGRRRRGKWIHARVCAAGTNRLDSELARTGERGWRPPPADWPPHISSRPTVLSCPPQQPSWRTRQPTTEAATYTLRNRANHARTP